MSSCDIHCMDEQNNIKNANEWKRYVICKAYKNAKDKTHNLYKNMKDRVTEIFRKTPPEPENISIWEKYTGYRAYKKIKDKSYNLYKGAKDRVTGIFKKTPPEPEEIIPLIPPTKCEKIKIYLSQKGKKCIEFAEKTNQYIKKHPKRSAAMAAAIIVTAMAIRKIFFRSNRRRRRQPTVRRQPTRQGSRGRAGRPTHETDLELALRLSREAEERRQKAKKKEKEEEAEKRRKIEIPLQPELEINDDDPIAKECGICYDDKHPQDFHRLACGHEACKNCLRKRLQIAINENKGLGNLGELECPAGCSKLISQKDIRALTNNYREVEERIEDMHMKKLLEIAKKDGLMLCPAPDCGYAIYNPDKIKQHFTCKNCKTNFCTSCCLPHARTTSCQDAKRLQIKEDNVEKTIKLLRTLKTRPRPNCRNDIEKNVGCPHMTCRRCRYEFCWSCMERYHPGRMCRRRYIEN